MNELCQINLADLQSEDDISYFNITSTGDNQRVKNPNSQRRIPVHPMLVSLGFETLVRQRRGVGERRLFPELRLDMDGYFSGDFTKFFSLFLKRIGIKTNKTSFHSFRHNFEDACRNCGVPPTIEAPNIVHTNSLNENVMDIQEKDRHDIVLANPPFGGGERREVQQNFPIRTGETAYLFLQHFIRKLKAGGRGAVVIKNTFLSNTDNASVALRRELLESCQLHTILDCPQGTFQGAGVKTVVLFFEKGAPTRDIWFYQLDPGRSLGKTNPLNDDDLAEFVELSETCADSEKSWTISAADLDEETYDLSVKNPNAPEEAPLRSPEEIITDMLARDAETAAILEDIRGML